MLRADRSAATGGSALSERSLRSRRNGSMYVNVRDRLLGFFLSQRLAVVVRVVDHVLDRVAFLSPGDDDARPPLRLLRLLVRPDDGGQVVPVNLLREPAERLP